MNFALTVRIALRALGKNKLRAALTVLGIVIGVAAVILIVSVGQGATAMVQGQVQGLGTNVLMVFPGSIGSGGVQRGIGTNTALTPGDCNAIARECSTILAASPIVSGSGSQVIYGNVNWQPNEISGVNATYLTVRNWPVVHGAFFTDQDVHGAAKVCVIGQTLVDNLFQTTNPLGKTIRIKNIPFQVVGVLEQKGASMTGQDQDNLVLAPYTTVKKRLSGSAFDNVNAILASARTADQMDDAENEIRSLLRERHHIKTGDKEDFTLRNTAEIANVLGSITGGLTVLLVIIGSVSLVVGGIGIMNIMLVSVTERTREIGIRLAVGARGADILRQFLIEAVLLSLFGGLMGVLAGVGLSVGGTYLINYFFMHGKWPVIISVASIVIALSFSAAVGMFFGFYPSLKASRLDPIDSLRYE